MARTIRRKPTKLTVQAMPAIGAVYRHKKNGRTATVLNYANMARFKTLTPRKWPASILYMHNDGSVWVRPVKAFMESFTAINLPQKLRKQATHRVK